MSLGFGMLIKVKVKSLSRVRLFATPWTVAYQAPPSMGFSRQEYWSGLPFPSPGDLSNPGIEPGSPEFQADALTSEPPGKSHSIIGRIQLMRSLTELHKMMCICSATNDLSCYINLCDTCTSAVNGLSCHIVIIYKM